MKIALLLLIISVVSEGHPHHEKVSGLKNIKHYWRKPMAPKLENHDLQSEELFDMGISPSIVDVNRESGSIERLGLHEADILPKKGARNTITDPNLFWTTRKIPIVYSNDLSLLAKAAIDEARREYELRTCFSFVGREDEANYLFIEPDAGCYSYVGMIGGGQTVSIGNGCEQMATVQHELMHALGIWHEQSRADRDDYVDILWANIQPGRWSNFVKYDFNTTDDRRVPYDFNSVMHYDKTAFSSDGNVTIQTFDPYFENVIGQRSTFSEGDVTKIQRMYGCSDTLRISYKCNFEEESTCGFMTHNITDEVPWFRHTLTSSDSSSATSRYLPDIDNTLGRRGYGSFLYFDTSFKLTGYSGSVKSMRFETTVARQCLEFAYYLRLQQNTAAAFAVYVATIDQTSGDIVTLGSPIVSFDHTSPDMGQWNVQRMTITAPGSTYRVIFVAKTGGHTTDIIAIDDVAVVDKECDTSYFLIQNYDVLLDTLPMNSYNISPIMYTGNPGYAYQLLIYPTGTQYEGYMSIYFRLVGGIYDDQLEWPFDKQFIRMVVTDQGPDPLTRMNHYYNFITDATSIFATCWIKPSGLGEANPSLGYGAFMRTDDFYTRMYLKNGAAYFSVQVTDMRPYEANSTDNSAQFMANPMLRSATDLRNFEENMGTIGPHEHHEHHHHDDHDDKDEDGMVTVATAAMITLISCGVVFLVMSVVICCVAQSQRSRLDRAAPYVLNSFESAGGSEFDQSNTSRLEVKV